MNKPIRLHSELIEAPGPLEAIEIYFNKGWSDGLPVVPPTPESVSAILETANLSPEAILGIEPVKGAVITAEKAAINAVMAGCKPEYMPVIVAAVDAITKPEFNLHGITVSTMGAAIMIIVNGPITKELDINSGVSAFGPGYRANATIGRAIRLIVMNVLGTRSKDGLDKATLGHPGKYTWCVAENEEFLPAAWESLSVTRGIVETESAVTVVSGLSATQFGEHEANTPEAILDAFAERLYPMGPGVEEVVLAICPEHIAHFDKAGWSKQQVGQYLFENARKSGSDWAAMGLPAGYEDQLTSVLASPESAIPIVIAAIVIVIMSSGILSKPIIPKIKKAAIKFGTTPIKDSFIFLNKIKNIINIPTITKPKVKICDLNKLCNKLLNKINTPASLYSSFFKPILFSRS